ncbi:capsular polysaccharide biosynthesis protein [Shimia aestuarii]|uniref:Capsular polysaccharide export protein n=1 Tax=Shimia aestuarii TaxID=254406 RepID=A0A1I4LYH6_9RHOB|nr:capsular polysaccharide biosynthesis protein [Shimia aestuarii]SFL96002.1 capsular polysaccharide export protein [Shimia aestuarii]
MQTAAGDPSPQRLFAFNGGFYTQRRLRRILTLSGYKLSLGRPTSDDQIAVWGQSPTSGRGHAMSRKTGAELLFVEDAFLRSVHPGRVAKEPPLGLFIDNKSPHFDPGTPSDLETLLATHPLDDSALLNRARAAIARIRENHLTKYSGVDPTLPAPDPGYVLVIDQTRGDASVTASQADDARFREMLVMAQEEHPGCPVVIKTHPETAHGHRTGFFGTEDISERVRLCTAPISPWVLFEGAVGVYTVSSQMGFEAIFAGHKPRIFGQPFYAGWGLTVDEFPVPRRQRKLTRAQLFAASMILYPTWYDPCRDRLCSLEDAISQLEAQTRCWREDRHGWNAHGMRLWKRKSLQKFFGSVKPVVFDKTTSDRPDMTWASKPGPKGAVRIEDGFLRSRGLGAELVPPLSLVCDDLGIYYDPARESRLERLIAMRNELRPDQRNRAEDLITAMRRAGLSKYNLDGARFDLPVGRKVLVPGQVEDDASILSGTETITSNRALLEATRAANPDAVLIYKPHPDVEAGLRKGNVPNAGDLADLVLEHADMAALLEQVDEVWTMTSLTGFEALLRECRVVTLGAPFYAGWGLTDDRGIVPERRKATPDLAGLVHATLIDYPRYFDPKSGLPCPVETVLERLSTGDIPHPGWINRVVSKIQGRFASYQSLWR